MPRLAMVGRLLKKAFLRQDRPAYKMMGGRKKLRSSHLRNYSINDVQTTIMMRCPEG